MKDYEVKVLDEKDHLFIETLKNRGISRNVATIVTYLTKLHPVKLKSVLD